MCLNGNIISVQNSPLLTCKTGLIGCFRITVDRALAQTWNILSSGIFVCQIFFSFYESYLSNEIVYENFIRNHLIQKY
jgi:hypothetical protein